MMMRRKVATCVAAAGLLMTVVSGCAAVAQGGPWTGMETSAPAAPLVVAEVAGESTPRLDELLGSVTVVDKLPNIPGYERGCGTGEAPLTELNAERCWSEGVGSMWVGSLRT